MSRARALWAVAAAFGTYFCMYAFRKPFTAASYGEIEVWGIGYKTVLVSAQVIGYMLSKFIGIRVIAEMPPDRRARTILLLIGSAEAALIGFALVPPPYNCVFIFANGLPLGMVFGLVLGFLEGRRLTEALTAGLCASFILADGVTKSVGAYLLSSGVPHYWMPAVAGILFLLPLGICLWMLTRVPPPDDADTTARTERTPLSRRERWALFRRFAGGLVPLVILYTLITILRSVRADFGPELWNALGEQPDPSVFMRSETLVAACVLLASASTVFIQDNHRAFDAALGLSMLGVVLIAVALVLRTAWLSSFVFMVLTGLGLYLPYVVVHTTVFERLIAMTRARANLGFLMYLADSFGYLGYVGVMLSRGLISGRQGFLDHFVFLSWAIVGLALLCLLLTWRYFLRSRALPPEPAVAGAPA